MGLPRSTYYDAPAVKADDAGIVLVMTAICDAFEAYGYRRVGAELRHRGMVVNSKKIRRLMREQDFPKRRRRFVATTDSDHDCPIFPDLAHNRIVDGPEPALGRGYYLHRHCDGLLLPAISPHQLARYPFRAGIRGRCKT
jgi:HTH-like domain